MHNLDARRAKRILLTQAAATLLLAAAATAYSLAAGMSALLGGLIATVANALFAVAVFGRYEAQEPGRLVARFYGAELLKLLVTALAFAAAFVWLEQLNVVALLGAFLLVQVLPPLLANRVAG